MRQITRFYGITSTPLLMTVCMIVYICMTVPISCVCDIYNIDHSFLFIETMDSTTGDVLYSIPLTGTAI